MNNTLTLPENYREVLQINLQKNKKLATAVNLAALGIMILLFFAGLLFVPFTTIADNTLPKMAVMCFGMLAYILLHEAVHGIFMRLYSGVKPYFGFTGAYAYAASKSYFNKKSYLVIGLSPVVIWGIVLLLLNLLLPASWFWPVYFIQISNLSGAAGDYYVTARLAKMPADILVYDVGTAMTVYAPSEEE